MTKFQNVAERSNHLSTKRVYLPIQRSQKKRLY